MYDLIVVGAGAAGLLAAGRAASLGARVLLLERNERVGKKLLITGKGRCNLTNNCDLESLLAAVKRNPRFLYGAFSALSPQDVMEFFEELQVPLKTERGQRVFPVSDKSVDIVAALQRFTASQGVQLRRHRVTSLLLQDGQVTGVLTADDKRYEASSVLIATGGVSYPMTGSTGDGYQLAKQAGHTVLSPQPTLVPIVTKEKWCSDLMGLSLKNVTLTVKKGDKPLFCEMGEMMFTHFGISGPLVLSASALMEGDAGQYRLFIDLKPALDTQTLDARLLRDFSDSKNKAFKNSLGRLLPSGLIPVFVALAKVPPDLQVNSITREQRASLVTLLKQFPLTPFSLRPVEEAVVTRGGVDIKEISPKTMGSKLTKGLFFAGEVMDLDAVTGGFNLQIAFSTAYLAAQGAVNYCNEVKTDV